MALHATARVSHSQQGAWQQKWNVEWQLADLREKYGDDDSTSNVALPTQIVIGLVPEAERDPADMLDDTVVALGAGRC